MAVSRLTTHGRYVYADVITDAPALAPPGPAASDPVTNVFGGGLPRGYNVDHGLTEKWKRSRRQFRSRSRPLSVPGVRLCAMGERCTQRAVLGQPAKLSQHNKDDICGACREQQLDAEVGSIEERGPTREAIGRGRSGSRKNEHGTPAQEGTAGQSQPASLVPEAVLAGKAYERRGMPEEEWRQLCERHGGDPDSDVLYVWEETEPDEDRRDNKTVCGKRGVAISGYALVCEECWGLMRSGEPPRVCEPWDGDPTPPEERYDDLLRAARTLLRAGVTREEEIIPTLVWAAKSWDLGILKALTDRFVEAGEGTEEWAELKGRFAGALSAFEPIRVVDGVLVLRWVPSAVTGVVDRKTGITETILIDVRRRSVKPEDVARRYQEYLRRKQISHEAFQGSVGFAVSNGVIRLSVHPEEPWAHPMGRLPKGVHRKQLPFPPPRLVECNYRGLRGSRRKGQGFGFTLFGREGGQPPKDNTIPATCAWYLGRRGRLIEQPSQRPAAAHLLNTRLLGPCGKQTLAEGTWTPSDTVWSTVKVVGPSILRAEHELREAYIALGFLL